MTRRRSTKKILNEALDWLGGYPALMRLESDGKSPEEVAELAAVAAAMARLHNRLWQDWRRNHNKTEESKNLELKSSL
jgi:hypothetical protein